MSVRVRFSPAPSGYLHVGSARAALFNWLYAKATDGKFILRIEDTDATRIQPELVDAIHDSLNWLGLDWDEEYRQSERFDQYRRAVDGMLESGKAYRCDCTQDAVKERAEARGETSGGGYDNFCRDRNVQPGEGVVVRFAAPDTGVTEWDDLVRGHVSFDNANLEDFVIVRSNGAPMFHVANAYDDWEMGITHVVRGEDHVNTTPRVLLLREAMGAPGQPIYAHLPLIVNEQRKKLSKRRDDVAVGDYKDRGYLPLAMRNYLLTLGWGPKDGQEIRPMEEFAEVFDLADINKAPAFFDVKKLDHFNGEYIRMLSPEELIEASLPFAGEALLDMDLYRRLLPLVQPRLTRLDEIGGQLQWVVGIPPEPTEKDWNKVMLKPDVPVILQMVQDRLQDCEWTPDGIEAVVFGVGAELGAKTQLPVRMAVSGSRVGMPLFEPMAEIPRPEILRRLEIARAKLDQ